MCPMVAPDQFSIILIAIIKNELIFCPWEQQMRMDHANLSNVSQAGFKGLQPEDSGKKVEKFTKKDNLTTLVAAIQSSMY